MDDDLSRGLGLTVSVFAKPTRLLAGDFKDAQFWINHDKVQRDTLKMSPAFYD